MLSGGLFVARIILRRELQIDPGIIAVPSGCDSELASALSAHAISLSPGELVVEIDELGVMYTHALDITRSEENIIDRLMGADLISTLTISVIVLVAIILRDSIYVDVALGLAAIGFIGVIALAKYIADEQMF